MKAPATVLPRDGHTDIDPGSLDFARNMRTKRLELWGCLSDDGVWDFRRIEDVGTSWTVTHRPTGRQLHCEPNLWIARRSTFDGWTLAQLDRQLTNA